MKKLITLLSLAIILSMCSLACKKVEPSGNTSDSSASSSAGGKSTTTNNSEAQQSTGVDRDKVLSETSTVVKEYLSANDKGDIKALERLLANDFLARWQGKVYDKNGWMEGKTPADKIAADDVVNPTLIGYTADTATIHFDRRISYNEGSPSYTEKDSISLVKKDGQWQIKEHISGH
jgi:hypothetical protein